MKTVEMAAKHAATGAVAAVGLAVAAVAALFEIAAGLAASLSALVFAAADRMQETICKEESI